MSNAAEQPVWSAHASEALAASKLAIFFHPMFSDGGVERTNIFLAKGLLERGYRVEFLTTEATDHYRYEVEEAGIHLVELGGKRTLLSMHKVLRHLITASAGSGQVYFISCQYYVNVLSMLLAMILRRRRRNIRFINSERNHFCEFQFRGGLKSRLILLLVSRLYRFADVVIANSQETAADLAAMIGREVRWNYNPTINERLESLRAEPVHEAWFLSDARPCVMAIGRLSAQKDFGKLLEAFRIVRQRLDAKLVILGEGEQRGYLQGRLRELQLEKDVYLPGFVENPYKFLARSDVFVLSSRYEGLPNALIEAVRLGIPCVSTMCKSGPKEILLDGTGGYLVPVGDEQRMAQAVLAVFDDPQLSRSQADKALRGIGRFRYQEATEAFERAINP